MIRYLQALRLVPIILGISLLAPAVSYADTALSEDLTTSPISLNLHVSPGSSVTRTIEVMNNSTVPVTIDMELNEFRAAGTSGYAQIYPSKAPEASWVTFSPSTFAAQPSVWSKVQMTIALPYDADLGYYFVPVFSPVENVSTQGTGATFKGSNGILVLVDTGSANENRAIKISSFSVDKSVYEYLPVNFSVTLQNTGNIYNPAYGDIYISRSSNFSSSITALGVNTVQGNILPDSSRVFTASWNNGFPVYVKAMKNGKVVLNKKGQPEYTLSWKLSNLSNFRFGKYYAKLLMVYNNGDRQIPLQAVISFWVIPWKLILIFIVILACIGLGLFTIYRYVTSAVKQTRKKDTKKDKN